MTLPSGQSARLSSVYPRMHRTRLVASAVAGFPPEWRPKRLQHPRPPWLGQPTVSLTFFGRRGAFLYGSEVRKSVTRYRSDEHGTEFIQSLAKGLAVIESFDSAYPAMTLTMIARRNHLSPGSARRVLLTLTQLGYLSFRDQRYELSARTLQLGYSYLASLPIIALIQPRLAEVSERLNESCSVMTLDGKDVVCIARVTARRLNRDYMSVGSRFPAHASSAGKLLLSTLPSDELESMYREDEPLTALTRFTVTQRDTLFADIEKGRADGWMYINQETALGLASLAVPIRCSGPNLYALSTSAPSHLERSDLLTEYLPHMQRAAEIMGHSLEAGS